MTDAVRHVEHQTVTVFSVVGRIVLRHLGIGLLREQRFLAQRSQPLVDVTGGRHQISCSLQDAARYRRFKIFRIGGRRQRHVVLVPQLVNKARAVHSQRLKNPLPHKVLVGHSGDLLHDLRQQKVVGIAVFIARARLKVQRLLKQPRQRSLTVLLHRIVIGKAVFLRHQ